MMGKEISNRQWLSQRLRRFLWGKRVAPLLAELEYGWLDGGCHTCANGLYHWLMRSRALEPAAVNRMIIADLYCPAHHVVVRLLHNGRRWYFDANGVSTEEHLLRYWRQEEHLRDPWLREYDDALLSEVGIVCLPRISVRLAEELLTVFGPFSPTWLDE